ncbi:MAG: hypothetical protein M1142_04595, partial [Patescibacteria group bacterium]|nr:hypothetical protein [Patescibacteria group bacterium]
MCRTTIIRSRNTFWNYVFAQAKRQGSASAKYNISQNEAQSRFVGELADHIHLSVRIKGFRYIKTALKLAGIKSLSELKGGIDEN